MDKFETTKLCIKIKQGKMKRFRPFSSQHHKSKSAMHRFSMSVLMKIFLFYFTFAFTPVKSHKSKSLAAQETKQTVCYGPLGCFSALPPFSPDMPLPKSPKKIGTEFYLRTRQNRYVNQRIVAEAANLTESYFDPSKPTKVVIHGFVMMNPILASWVPEVTQTILYHDDVNVIQVNWVNGANMEYDNAASNTRIVGAQVAYLINMLMEVHNAKARDFHLIGFSLGAHVAGFAGKIVQKNGKVNKIGRITGLDPANPAFNYNSPKVRLDKSDAKFVDVIHTDTSTVLVIAAGMNRNLGHADFFPNGGADQIGCHNGWSEDSTWISSVTDWTACDHLRAPELFKHSINATGDHFPLMAYKCSSYEKFKRGVCLRCGKGGNRCRRMGYWAEPPRGRKNQVQYYAETAAEAPFTAKHYQVQIHWRNSSNVSVNGFKAKLFITLHGAKKSTDEVALNDGATFQVIAGRTTRFLVTQDTEEDIGDIERVTFRWERPTCWTYFFCSKENIRLKRIKIFAAHEQKRYLYLPLGRNRDQRIRAHFVQPGQKFEMLRTSFIRRSFPRRYPSIDKETARHFKKYGVYSPALIQLRNGVPVRAQETTTSTSAVSLTTASSNTQTILNSDSIQ